MATSDIVAVGLVVACGLLGMRGCFRWISGAVLGVIVGVGILAAISLVSVRPWSGQVGSFFTQGNITPSIGQHIKNVAKRAGIEAKDDHYTETEDAQE